MKKIAFVHDWFDKTGGPEKVLKEMRCTYPDSRVFSLVNHSNREQLHSLNVRSVETSFLQGLPFSKSCFRGYLPLMPLAIEQFNLSKFDLVLSSSHSVAKGVITGNQQLHVSYVHTPIRYAWELQHEYLESHGLKSGAKSMAARVLLHYLRMWDRSTANRVDVYVANSKNVAGRIRKSYNRTAHVIYPPVDTERFQLKYQKENFYLAAGNMVPHKRLDLIIKAFSRLPQLKLVVIGDGSELHRCKSLAGSNVEFLGYQPDAVLCDYMQRAKAFVHAGMEDFGIMPVEAQSCGTPVIALGKGGTAETVIHGRTGLHFEEQTTDSLVESLLEMEVLDDFFDPHEIRNHAEKFSVQRFRDEFKNFIEQCWRRHVSGDAGVREEQLSRLGLAVSSR